MIKFIDNIGDYFSTNYFDEDFIKKVIDKSSYSAEDIKTINKKISPIKDLYYRYKNEFLTLKRPKDRIKYTNQFHTSLLNALGYQGEKNDYNDLFLINGKEGIPVRSKLYRGEKPHLFIMEMQSMVKEGENSPPGIFEQRYFREQWESIFTVNDPEISIRPSIINEALSELFLIEQDLRPAYVLMLAGSEIYLIHYEKWFRGSYLRFSLEDLFDEATLNRDYYSLFYFLLSKEALSPDSDIILMDQLDEDSHKSAYAVTQDLKEGVIKAIEDLANEAVFSLYQQNAANCLDENFAKQLKDECLTFVYRLLFMLYAESREELEILPVNDEVYQKGYGLEMLRDLELVPLQSESARNGYFFHKSLTKLFSLLSSGYDVDNQNTKSIIVRKIDSPLFDDRRFHILNKVKFRNFILQDIICQLSLSQKQRGKNRGRISYANLGINQLGSVYEGLLSYRGFFADEDYIEVKRADDPTGKEGTYVVPRRRRGDFEEDEILKDSENQERDKIINKGTFIYRLSGRDRQKSASYYTPEVLTQTTVKYTLKPIFERLEKGEIKADDLLKLKILEPAMGAAAFHNEVINQVASAYLNAKQKESIKKVPPNSYREELQKVKAYIATHNVYGVDINPTAVELGKISLWLNVIHKDMETPFFGYRLGVGNAVVGAWRKVYSKADVIREVPRGLKKPLKKEWWEKAPRQIPWTGRGAKRKADEVYHFLLPDKNMVPSSNIKMLKDEYKKNAEHISKWRKEFTEPITEAEFKLLLKISDKIDELFEEHYKNQVAINEQTHTNVIVWGHQGHGQGQLFNYTDKEKVAGARNNTNAPYYKLKTIMDYWCSLWFWDMREAEYLPKRSEYIDDILNLLEIDINALIEDAEKPANDIFAPPVEQTVLSFAEDPQLRLTEYKSSQEKSKVSELIADSAVRTELFENKRLSFVKKYSEQYFFFHYELEFIEVFKERGGFDIIVGNPPWVKITFEERNIIGEAFPEVLVKDFTAPEIAKIRNQFVDNDNLKTIYHSVSVETESLANFMNSKQVFSSLVGQQTDLFRAILVLTLCVLSERGIMGLITPDSVYDDPNGKLLRAELYGKLLYLFEFKNELKLFPIDHHNSFCLNIYAGKANYPSFDVISNLFHPSTIDASFIHSGHVVCEGIKVFDKVKNKYIWNTQPHKDRLIKYSKKELSIIAKSFEDSDSWESPRLVSIHSIKLLEVIRKIGEFPTRVHQFESKISECWHETNDVNVNIERLTGIPDYNNYGLIYSGPHFYISNPFYKTPREICRLNSDYDNILLDQIPKDYLPRVNYKPFIEPEKFLDLIDGFLDEKTNKYDKWIEYYKLGFSKMLSITGARTLQPAILPSKASHINGVISIIFRNQRNLIELTGLCSSIVLDYFVKSIGSGNLTDGKIKYFPLGIQEMYYFELCIRVLRLNCLTNHYKDIWENNFKEGFRSCSWSKSDGRLSPFVSLENYWTRNSALRNYYERRLSLIEIDVISSMALGLILDELLSIYTIQFPVMQSYEDETFYDIKGNIVFTSNSQGLKGIGVSRKRWEEIKDNKDGEIVEHIIDYELHRGTKIIYYPPFEKCDRIEDYKRAWAHFEKIFAGN